MLKFQNCDAQGRIGPEKKSQTKKYRAHIFLKTQVILQACRVSDIGRFNSHKMRICFFSGVIHIKKVQRNSISLIVVSLNNSYHAVQEKKQERFVRVQLFMRYRDVIYKESIRKKSPSNLLTRCSKSGKSTKEIISDYFQKLKDMTGEKKTILVLNS